MCDTQCHTRLCCLISNSATGIICSLPQLDYTLHEGMTLRHSTSRPGHWMSSRSLTVTKGDTLPPMNQPGEALPNQSCVTCVSQCGTRPNSALFVPAPAQAFPRAPALRGTPSSGTRETRGPIPARKVHRTRDWEVYL